MTRTHINRWRKYLVSEMWRLGVSTEKAEILVQKWLDEITTDHSDRDRHLRARREPNHLGTGKSAHVGH
jgi:hypothetical protein